MIKGFKISANTYRSIISLSLLFIPISLIAQIQYGVVRTALRPDKEIVYLEDVSIRQKGGHSYVLSGPGGEFQMPMPQAEEGDAFYLSSVRKNGYELADDRTIGRAFAYSLKVPIEIVMLNTREKEEDIMRITENSYRRAEETYTRRISALEKMLNEKVISEASYRVQLQELQKWYERYEELISIMAERYASMDYSDIDSLNILVNIAIENGDLVLADSLISTAGSLEKRVKEIKEAKIRAQQQLEYGRAMVKNASADLALISKDETNYAGLLYSKYSIFLTNAERDSAAFYIKLRADLDPTNVEWQNDAGMFMQDHMAEYDTAMMLYDRALRSAVKQYGENHPVVAEVYNNIVQVYYYQGKYSVSLENYNKALKIQLSVYGENHPSVATVYSNIGLDYYSQGRYSESLENYNKALIIQLSINGEEHPSVATVYNNIGQVYCSQGRYSEALKNYSKALKIQCSIYGEEHPAVATVYSNISQVYYSQGKYSESLENYNKALRIRSSIYGENHPDLATVYSNMGYIYYSMGEYLESLENYNKALKIQRSINGENHPSVATVYNNIGQVYCSLGRYSESLKNYNNVLNIQCSIYGENHPAVATSYDNIGQVHYYQGQYSESLANYNKA